MPIMIWNTRTCRLGGGSLLALLAASALVPVDAAAQCLAVPTLSTGEWSEVTAISVTCGPGDNAGPFATSGFFQAYESEYDGEGSDTVTISGGTVTSDGPPPLIQGSDENTLDSATYYLIETRGGDDIFTMTGGQIGIEDTFGAIDLGDGNDQFSLTSGTIYGNVYAGTGDDVVEISGGTIVGNLYGGAGFDEVTMRGGSVDGNIDADSVMLYGGTIGGYIFSSDSLVIDDSQSPTSLNLDDGAFFSGWSTAGEVRNTDLAQASGSGFKSQVFHNFESLSVTSSTLGFSETQYIDQLSLSGGSTLNVAGDVTIGPVSEGSPEYFALASHSSIGFGMSAYSSSVNMINGSASDTLRVGDFTLYNARIGLDIDQGTGTGDQIFVGGVLMMNGTNIIDVNLIGTPALNANIEVPILLGGGAPAGSGTFVVQGIRGTLSSVFNYQIVPNAAGDLILLGTPNVGLITSTKAAIDTQPAITALDALEHVTNDAIQFNLGLGGGGMTGVATASTFGVFASGQWARVNHGGYEVTSNGIVGQGPGFTADDFSAIMSLDFNAAKHFGLEDRYGLNFGVFGGYTSTDVSMDSFMGFPTVGNATNESGMFGAYGLFRQGYNYLLVSGTSFVGQTEISNAILATTGSYDTIGYAASASAGRIFVVSDAVRFDLRGGLVGVTFSGDAFTDSGGNNFGKSKVSFGAAKFEPGIYSVHQLDNGMVLSPYARGEMQFRFGYRNRGNIDDVGFDFDDSDFSTSLSAGFNLKMSDSATMSVEFRGKASADSTTLAGKIGLKYAF